MSIPVRVLIVEDSEDDALLVLRELERGGFEVTSERVDTPEAMTAALEGGEWDAIVCDFSMPRFNAIDALRLVCGKGLDVPFLMVSGTVGEDVAVDAIRLGANDYVTKDSLARLVPALKRELEEIEVRRQKKRTEEAERRKTQDLEFLARTALEFATFPPDGDIYGHIAGHLKGLVGNSIVLVGPYDATSNTVEIRSVVGLGKSADNVLKLLGRNLVGMRFGVLEEIEPMLRRGELVKLSGPMHELAQGRLPQKGLKAAAGLLGVADAYSLGIAREGELFASVTILAPPEAGFDNAATFAAFANQASVALQRRLAEEREKDRTRELEHLSRTAMEFAAFPPDGDIYEHVAKRLKEIAGDSIVFVNSFEQATGLIRCRAAAGLGRHLNRVLELIGRSPVGMSFPISDEAYQGLSTGKFTEVTGGLHTLALGQIPEKVCGALEKLLGVGDIFAVGMAGEGTLFGNAIVVTRARGEPENKAMIEAFVNQASAALQRKLAEGALRESEEKYRVLFEGAAEGILVADVETKIFAYANPAVCRMLGYSEGELKRMSVADIHPPESLDAVLKEFEAQARGEKVLATDIPCRRKDGSVIHADVHAASVLLGGRRCSVGFFSDVTERRRAQEVLARQAAIIESSDDAIVGKALDGVVTSWNAGAQKMYGYTAEEMIGRPISVLFPLGRAHEAMQILGRIAEGEGVERLETRRLRKDGTLVDVSVTVSPIRDAAGKVVGASSIARDVTDHKRAEEALQESEEKWRSLAENAPDLIMTIMRDGTISFVNRVVPGLSVNEVLGKNVRDFIEPEHADTAMGAIESVFRTGLPSSYEVSGTGPHGETAHYSSRIGPIMRGGGVVAAVQISTDVTDRRRAEKALRETEEQLRQSQKLEAVGRLAGGVAHDFNNMLGAIIGYSDVILRDLRGEDPLRRDVEQIKAAADRAARLTRQLLAFSRKQVLEPRVINLNSVVKGIEKMLRRLIGEDIELSTSLGGGLWRVRADPGQMEQVILNLAVNSRDAMPAGGKLTIETANVYLDEDYTSSHVAVRPGAYVMLAVSDTGSGMDEETRSHLFEPFYTTKEKGKGTGLGLSMVYGIVKQSGGNVWVYSEPGGGATFKIYLPKVAAETEAIPVRAPAREPERGSETVLVAEDEDMLRRLVSRMLGLVGYKVIQAANGGEALVACQRHQGPIHLLVTDVVMPGMSGRDLAGKLAEIRPELKVLFMSGYTDNAIVHHGVLDAGAAFIQKPFSASALAAKVREVLDTPASQA